MLDSKTLEQAAELPRTADVSVVDAGLFLFDKPLGLSSNQALQRVKRLLGVKKAGHTGSLDPLASGLLPICIGKATRLAAHLLDEEKRYLVEVCLGVTTETGDVEGAVIERLPVPELGLTNLQSIIDGFIGEIDQVPPMYSALKHKGQRLYELARQGIEVERKARRITIHEINLLNYADGVLTLDVRCSKGTYIRTLAEDIGYKIGCGAHVQLLRRTAVGAFNIEQAWNIEQLEALADHEARQRLIQSADIMVKNWPLVTLTADWVFAVSRGQVVSVPNLPEQGWMRIYNERNQFIGIGEIDEAGDLAPRRVFIA